MNKIFNVYAKDTTRNLFGLVAAVLFVCPLSFLMILVPLWLNTSGQISDNLLMASFVAWFIILLGEVAAYALVTDRRRKKWLDSIFSPLGLSGKRYLMAGWKYSGMLDGRMVHVLFYRGPTLQISLQTGLNSRFGIAAQDQPGLFLAGRQPLPALPASLPGIQVCALDPDWTRRLLEEHEIPALLTYLMSAGDSWALLHQVILLPGFLRLTLYRNKNLYRFGFTTEEVRQWIGDLSAILNHAERLPSPTITAVESRLEQAEREGKVARNAALFVLGFLGIMVLCMGLAIWLIVTFF